MANYIFLDWVRSVGGSLTSCIRRTASSKAILQRPDPAKEICDIQIKIADLGNACWIVSLFTFSL